ncbi:OadG family protein [Motiliproteus sediminis]|uniref:OadG family protein n=1 Tax=Motiliproteus sediminis TaxID=1468178 RepID=UPI001AEFED72|nr:OadG family protein [Motiliproteus sediminis]
MENNDLISQGLTLMVFGMGFVFIFLTLLVGVTNLMSVLVTRYLPEPEVVPAAPRRAAPAATDEAQLLAVISAAVHQYRQRHRK